MWSRWSATVPALVVGLLCVLVASPVFAHPGSLWGIDLSSVISLRDQARVMAHHHDEEKEGEEDELKRLEQVQTVVLDPGHGGDNSGATGVAGIAEKQLTLELAYELRERLQQQYPTLRVVLTRYWDASVDLGDRVHLANLANADLFISLHYNAAPHERAIGFETYFLSPEQVTPGEGDTEGHPIATTDPSITGLDGSTEPLGLVGQHGDTLRLIERDLLRAHSHDLSGHLAEQIQDQFVDQIDSVDRGVKQANFAVLKGAHMPAVVVEAGFLTHPEEGFEVLAPTHQSAVTSALVDAVEKFDTQMAETLGEGEFPTEIDSDDGEQPDPDDHDDAEDGEPMVRR